MTKPDWSPQQLEALEDVRRWLDSDEEKRPQVFYLFGYAGTGKTTLAIHVADMVKGDVLFASFTGKAALMMRRKGCHGAQTIHSLIYEKREQPDGTVLWKLNRESALKHADLLVIDECSMVNEEMGNDLLSFDVPILVLGDPAQLPPVNGEGFFTSVAEPHVLLTEIHRQAAESPILRLATAVREGRWERRTGSFAGALSIVSRDDVRGPSLLAADQILVGTNAFRRAMNDRMRRALHARGDLKLGDDEQMPVVGDRVICLRNKSAKGLLNGGMWRVKAIKDRAPEAKRKGARDVSYLRVDSDDVETVKDVAVQVPHAFWRGAEKDLDKYVKRYNDEFDYAYAITCHKSQGSQWDKVLVYDDSGVFGRSDPDIPRRWLYTAVTRAAEKLIVAI